MLFIIEIQIGKITEKEIEGFEKKPIQHRGGTDFHRVREKRGGEKKELTQEQMAFLEKRRRMRREAKTKQVEESHIPIDLFDPSQALGLFKPVEKEAKDSVILSTWAKCEARELRILSTQRPRNMLEDMAVMTDRGILWHFPINNEQGIDESEVRRKKHRNIFSNPQLFDNQSSIFRWNHFTSTCS